jgi:hypothetical protein
MQRWKAYMKSSEAAWRRAETIQPAEERVPVPPSDEPDIGAPWFPDCEPFPRAT